MSQDQKPTILITQSLLESEMLVQKLEDCEIEVFQCPLEKLVPSKEITSAGLVDDIQKVDNIIYGNLLSARFFLQFFGNNEIMELLRSKVNLGLNQEIADFLESFQIPVITSEPNNRPIDLVELMLRLGRLGACLYPCRKHLSEELPGLFVEMDVPCIELPVYEKVGPTSEELERYRVILNEKQPDFIVFHNVDSIGRTIAAFSELEFSDCTTIAYHQTIARKMQEKSINVDLIVDSGKIDDLVHEITL